MTQALALQLRRSVDLMVAAATLSWALLIHALGWNFLVDKPLTLTRWVLLRGTACLWEKDDSHSYVLVSDYLLHDKYAAMTFLALSIDLKHFENYMFFSDGAASQFKQRFTLCEITLLRKSLSWNFFATGYDKGDVDTNWGTLKRDLHTGALAKNVAIKNIDDFFDVAWKISTKINVLKCSNKQVPASVTQIVNDVVGISAIQTSQNMHS